MILMAIALSGGIITRILGGGLLAYYVFRAYIIDRSIPLTAKRVAKSVLSLGIGAGVLFKSGIKWDHVMEKGVNPMLTFGASLLAIFLAHQLIHMTVDKAMKLTIFALTVGSAVGILLQHGVEWDSIVTGFSKFYGFALFMGLIIADVFGILCCAVLLIQVIVMLMMRYQPLSHPLLSILTPADITWVHISLTRKKDVMEDGGSVKIVEVPMIQLAIHKL